MSITPVSGLASSYLQSLLATLGSSPSTSTTSTSTTQTSASGSSIQDSNQMSPFAMMLSELQQLQQSNPTQYQQVTAQISANLQTAAQQATSEGNTTAANQLSQLSTDFSNASTTGQLPNIQDLSQAMSGHHHHGGHHHHSSVNLGSGSSSSSDTSSSSSSTSQSLQQLLGAFQSSSLENDALNPISIITQTLESAGVTLGS